MLIDAEDAAEVARLADEADQVAGLRRELAGDRVAIGGLPVRIAQHQPEDGEHPTTSGNSENSSCQAIRMAPSPARTSPHGRGELGDA